MRKTFSKNRRGSALLIVLGFLSFMMISAVSFAIYMRIEREASSNYRHTSTSRHLLDTALVRAMDEIDSELRITAYNDGNRRYNDNTVPPIKFPTNWTGRVRCSAVANGADNNGNARVLSLDALAYIPAIFVNDVRRFAVPNEDDKDDNGSEFNDDTAENELGQKIYAYNSVENWHGAKWRPICQPLLSFEGENNANTKPEVGRYAYVCINLSDMLNVNQCRAALENCDSVSNRISIGHLFENETAQTKFDQNLAQKDRYYETMADFYACMSDSSRQDPTFANGRSYGAPYQYWLRQQNENSDKNEPDKYFGTQSRSYAATHVLATDSIVKAEPRASSTSITPFNLKVNSVFQNTSVPLTGTIAPGSQAQGTYSLNNNFFNALKASINSDDASSFIDPICSAMYGGMIADYLDTDNLPRFLCMPSMERTPQINRIFMPNSGLVKMQVSHVDQEVGGNQGLINRIWTVKFTFTGSPQDFLNAQVLFPFVKDSTRDVNAYSVQLNAAFYAAINQDVNNRMAAKRASAYPAGSIQCVSDVSDIGTGTWSANALSAGYHVCKVVFPNYPFSMPDVTYTENNLAKGAALTYPKVSVRLVVLGCLYQGTSANNAMLVDAVPMNCAQIGTWNTQIQGDQLAKLSFAPNGSITPQNEQETTIAWQYTNLECPDPRFNWRVDNWVANNNVTANNSDTAAGAGATEAAALIGKEGRDGDFYQNSKNTGTYLQSPGELGFFPRPFTMQANAFSSGGINLDVMTSVNQLFNYKDMFRTIRLYDHTVSHKRDKVFRYLYYANDDGTLDGPRVNPLSDLNLVLAAAISSTPMDYYWAAQSSSTRNQHCIYTRVNGSDTSGLNLNKNDWGKITNGWFQCLQYVKGVPLNNLSDASEIGANKTGVTLNNSYLFNLSDVYGDSGTYNGHMVFNWYTDGDETTIFKSTISPQTGLSKSLPECYRKMLYSYTLDNFSDRQQLFLYILYAEAVVPSLGGSADSGVKSLAGGRAVALVWRDPYPAGYTKTVNGNSFTESWTTPADLYKGDRETSSEDSLKRISPWYQYSLRNQRGKYDDDKDEFGTSSSERYDNNVVREGENWNSGGYHEQRVLFFKILDN